MKKSIDISQTLKNFEGVVIKDELEKEITLKMILMGYMRSSQLLGLSDTEMNTAYQLGFAIGGNDKDVELSTTEYDTLKKITDTKGRYKGNNGQEGFLWGLEITGQVKEMVDKAIVIDSGTSVPKNDV